MKTVDAVILVILSGWFASTVLVQFPHPSLKRLRRFDAVGHLLPGWNFFAPKPIQADFALWYRTADVAADGELDVDRAGDWRSIAIAERRPLYTALVHPRRRIRKALFEACNRIAIAKNSSMESQLIVLGVPYLLLLSRASKLAPNSAAVQFKIDVVRYRNGVARPATMFTSEWHAIDGVRADGEAVA